MHHLLLVCLVEVKKAFITSAVQMSLNSLRASSKLNIKDELKGLIDELDTLQAFLPDIERIRQNSNVLTSVVEQVKNCVRNVEDMMEVMVYCGRGHAWKESLNSVATAYMTAHLSNIKTEFKEQIPRRIKDFYQTVQPALSREEPNSLRMWQPPETTHDAMVGEEFLGMDREAVDMFGWLISGTAGHPKHKVISICGMGGSGKTALARRLYNNCHVKECFDCSAWISMSQPYDTEQVLRSLITQVHNPGKLPALPDNLEHSSRGTLLNLLHDCLDQKRYVIVLDGVRSRNALDDFAHLLQIGDAGSRLVVTTRDHQLASLLSTDHIMNLQPLSESEAWSLFCSKAFAKQSGNCCPRDLEYWARKIVSKCEGLPLGIVTLGNLISSKDPEALTWNQFYSTLSSSLSDDDLLINMSRILMLDFDGLSYHKKQCYLYCCSLFPESYVIKKNWLVRLWVAEGFVEERPGITLEEVAEKYFDELVQRSLLLVANKDESNRVKACRVHGLVRERSLNAAREEELCTVLDEHGITIDDKARRLSIHRCIKKGLALPKSKKKGKAAIGTPVLSRLRSLVWFVDDEASADSFKKMSANFMLLKVLELRGLPIDRVPDAVVELYNLKYLSLRETKVKKLPKHVDRLQMLETLDTRGSKIATIPRRITELKNLRHLLTDLARMKLKDDLVLAVTKINSWVWHLKGLLTLKSVEADERIVEELAELIQLRRLGLENVKHEHGDKLCRSVSKMRQLLSLTIRAASDKTLVVDSLNSPPPHLRKIVLDGKMQKLPSCFTLLSSLTHLYMLNSQLEDASDPLPLLGRLENLVHLTLRSAYMGERLCFGAEQFVRLKSMHFAELERLNRLVVEEGALRSLSVFHLRGCKELRGLDGIDNLPALCHLDLEDMPKSFMSSLKGDQRLKM